MQLLMKFGLFLGIIFVAVQPVVLDAIFGLVFLGLVPGTSYSLPMWLMALVYLSAILVGVWYLNAQTVYIGDRRHRDKLARQKARRTIAKQRTKKSADRSALKTASSASNN